MAVSIEQAAVNALATFLQAKLPDVVVSSEWPNPDVELPEKALTIVKIGPRREETVPVQLVSSAPIMIGTPPAEDPINRLYTWRVKLIEQEFQLDVWSRYSATRDDIQARLDQILNSGTIDTLLPTSINFDEFRDGLLLNLDPADGHPGTADFMFDGPEVADEPDAVQRGEFRTTQRGRVSAALTITRAAPRLATISVPITTPSGGFGLVITDQAGESDTYTTES